MIFASTPASRKHEFPGALPPSLPSLNHHGTSGSPVPAPTPPNVPVPSPAPAQQPPQHPPQAIPSATAVSSSAAATATASAVIAATPTATATVKSTIGKIIFYYNILNVLVSLVFHLLLFPNLLVKCC